MMTNNRITVILAHLRGGVVGIYAQRKLNKLNKEIRIYCGNHLSQRQMITQAINLLSWISSGKFTRELNKESLLN